MDDEHRYRQSQEEIDAQMAAGGPVAAAQDWLGALIDERDFGRAWRLTDPQLRRLQTQDWIEVNEGHPALIEEDPEALIRDLTAESPVHPIWTVFAASLLRVATAKLAPVADRSQWGWASRPRPHAPGVEIALLVKTGGQWTVAERDMEVEVPAVVVQYDDASGWRVLGFDLPRPIGQTKD
jgi:hypothetical protein